MARASAWLAIILPALMALSSVVALLLGRFDNDFIQITALDVGGSLFLFLGGLVVLIRRKPGLRLLAAAWAANMGLVLGYDNAITAVIEVDTQYEIVLYLSVVMNFIGLLFALLARRPNHKD